MTDTDVLLAALANISRTFFDQQAKDSTDYVYFSLYLGALSGDRSAYEALPSRFHIAIQRTTDYSIEFLGKEMGISCFV